MISDELIKLNPDCGCPEIEAEIGMAVVMMHLDPDGHGDVFIDFGDWQEEKRFSAKSMDELYCKTEQYIVLLPRDQ